MKTLTRSSNPFFYIPNIIDYVRIVLLIAATTLFSYHAKTAILLFIINSILDACDGSIARALKQQTLLGALLDFSIDRAAFIIILMLGQRTNPQYWWLFILAATIDVSSHFAICYASSLIKGKHLDLLKKGSTLLKLFAEKSWFRYFVCTCHDLFFGLFVISAAIPWHWWSYAWIIFTPGMLAKSYIHIEQFILACATAQTLQNGTTY